MRNKLKYSGILILITICHVIYGQESNDMDLIVQQKFINEKYLQHRHVTFGIQKNQSFLAKYNPVNLTFSGLMFVYQKWFSPQISASCLYYPSCSAFGKMCFQEYGFIKGLFSTADRLMRCDRISAVTIHPISIGEDGKVHEDLNHYRLKPKN